MQRQMQERGLLQILLVLHQSQRLREATQTEPELHQMQALELPRKPEQPELQTILQRLELVPRNPLVRRNHQELQYFLNRLPCYPYCNLRISVLRMICSHKAALQ
jgi:hypothetical protein